MSGTLNRPAAGPLTGKVAVVAGATRGAGRGIAGALGEAGATVYCTGRSTHEKKLAKRSRKPLAAFELAARPETIEQTAELVTARGGQGFAVRVDHTVADEVDKLFQQVKAEQGRLDLLVNDIWGGDELSESKPFWKQSLDKGLLMLQRGLHTHLITARYAVPLMIETGSGLLIEITDGNGFCYRGNLYYDLVKTSVIRIAYAMATELKGHAITSLALTPGFLRSEAMLEHFGVTEANWQDAAKERPEFIESETPFYVGRAVAALASDPNVSEKTGRVFASWDLAEEYGFTDLDGRQPHFARWIEKNMPQFQWKRCDDMFYEYWKGF